MGRIIATSVFVLLIFSAFHIIEAQEKGLSEMSLEELMGLEVVSSTQTLIPLQEAPSTINVVTGDQIRRWGIRRLSELIERLIPGCYITEDGDDLIIGIRGLSSDINAKVLLLLNGHHYQTQWNNGLNTETELGLLQDIKQVEVINGPGGALYGSGATIGVINMITYTGADFKGVEATGNLGTGDYKRAEVMTGGMGDDHRTNYFFSAGGLTTDGYDNNDNDPLNISRYPPGWRFYGDVTYRDFRLKSRLTRSSRDIYGLPASTIRPKN
ncbi:TonB-dependent receptor plug domain-containing protein, partial [bacterium]|nr:TonB-dependent receptor plug domain-containing protein [bacterium]